MFFFVFQAFVTTGINLQLQFTSNAWSENKDDRLPTTEFVDFASEPGKVSHHITIFSINDNWTNVVL